MPLPQPKRLLTALLLLGAAATPAIAQEEPPPQEERPDARLNPLLTDPSLVQDVAERTTRPEPEAVLLPTRSPVTSQVVPNQPSDPSRLALADGEQWTRAATLLPEGTFLVRRVGEVVRLRTGGLAFVPATTPEGTADPAMPLLACDVYGRLAALIDGAQGRLWMAVTGEVFEYHGRNYLLPSAFASVGAQPEGDAAEGGAPDDAVSEEGFTDEAPPGGVAPDGAESGVADAPGEQEDGQPAVPTDPRIEELVRELESERAERRGLDTDFGSEAPAVEGAPPKPRIEGKLLLGRRARMVRGSGGGWSAVIDNDTDGALDGSLPERVHLLPSRLVREMERQAERRGESWTFQVSGNLYRHGEKVYLVPRLFVSLPQDEIDPLQ